MALKWLVSWAIAVLCLSGTADAQRTEVREGDSQASDVRADDDAKRPDVGRVADLVVQRTNNFRSEQSRKPVKSNEHLVAAAQYYARYMARTGRYGHSADGSQPSARAEEHGYDYCLVSENVAYQFSSGGFEAEALAEAFVQGWIDSPRHRQNMSDADVVDTGVAIARADDGTYYAVQMFGRPESRQIEFKVSNRSNTEVRYSVGDRSFPLPPRMTRTHTRCRPPEVRFDWPAGKAPAGQEAGQVVRPDGGAHLIVTDAAGDALELRSSPNPAR